MPPVLEIWPRSEQCSRATPDLVFAKDALGMTALHWAADQMHNDVAESLLAHGADLNARDKDNETPLHTAVRADHKVGHAAIVRLLLAHGADVNARDNDGWTPLHFAADNGDDTVVDLLLAYGAAANIESNGGYTPLHFAAASGHEGSVNLLLANNAEVNAIDDEGETPLRVTFLGDKDVVEVLYQNGGHK